MSLAFLRYIQKEETISISSTSKLQLIRETEESCKRKVGVGVCTPTSCREIASPVVTDRPGAL
eukprot:1875870-Prorocentrum_lima.AAC.1